MSTLVLVLATAMAVPGNGPEMVSLEIAESLHLEGEWMGAWRNCYGGTFEAILGMDGSKARIDILRAGERITSEFLEIIDEGEGKVRGRMGWDRRPFLGVYEQRGDHVVFCYRDARDGRPSSMKGLGHKLLILHRVKPRK